MAGGDQTAVSEATRIRRAWRCPRIAALALLAVAACASSHSPRPVFIDRSERSLDACWDDRAISLDRNGAKLCLYLINVFEPDVGGFTGLDLTERALVNRVRADRVTSFFSPHQTRAFNERVSNDGVLLIRLYDRTTGQPRLIADAQGVQIEVNGKTYTLPGLAHRMTFTIPMRALLTGRKLGDAITIEVHQDGDRTRKRYSWFRPRSGFALDLQLASFGVVIEDRCKNGCEVSTLPASVRLQYRQYRRADFYVFWSLGAGWAITTNDTKDTSGADRGLAESVKGLTVTATVNVAGAEIGGGVLWDFGEHGEVSPVVVFNLTEPLLRALGVAKGFPWSIREQATVP